ncbi:MAG TPA: TIGR00374 family protein, partial [Halomonas sp.]|nr:TIGR00374 family protein [Halomonas sp.]
MPVSSVAKPQRLLRFRPLHGVLLLVALVAPLVLTSLAGGSQAFEHVAQFPIGLLVLMIAMAALCWNLNAA